MKRKREDDSENKKEGWRDRDHYFQVKEQKLRVQFQHDFQQDVVAPQFFTSVCIYIDGFTRPSMDELKAYIYKYGGTVEQYYRPSIVSHVVAENLSKSKCKEFASMKEPPKVVAPSWIVDCAREQKRLDEQEYILACMKHARQGNLVTSPAKKKIVLRIKRSQQPVVASNSDMVQTPPQVVDNNDIIMSTPPKITELNDNAQQQASEPSQNTIDMLANLGNEESPKKKARYHLQVDSKNPDFIKSYFGSSRLHFIGQWKHKLMNEVAKPIAPAIVEQVIAKEDRVIVHIDMDCFFAAVVRIQLSCS